jgi:glycosyltransferase involved in cell wall biosynthesis
MLLRLKDKGVGVVVIASKSLGLKGTGQLPPCEDMDGVFVYRLYRNLWETFLFPRAHLKKVLQITERFKPDLIFCSQELNIRLAMLLQKHLNLPIVLLVEDAGRIFSGEAYQGIRTDFLFRVLGIPVGRRFWPWLCDNVSALITCHPRDARILERLTECGKPIFHLPWPTHVPIDFKPPFSRKHSRGIYIGSLYPFKNTQEFERTLPRILRETPTREFVVVGPGPHAKMVKHLSQMTSGSVKYIQELPRVEALRLIASSYYAYTPAARGGWGFIGDCWSVRTPIIMTHNDYYVMNDVNALVAEDYDSLIHNINRLYDEPELYKRLQTKGSEESERRNAGLVGDTLHRLLIETISNR